MAKEEIVINFRGSLESNLIDKPLCEGVTLYKTLQLFEF